MNISCNNRTKNNIQALDRLSGAWHLDHIRPLEPSSFTHNYVAVAYSHTLKSDVVLKICPEGIDNERYALEYFQESKCVKLLAYDMAHQGLLLEYVQPGTMLKSTFPHDEETAIQVFAKIVQSYLNSSTPLPDIFPTNRSWLHTLHTHISTIIPQRLLQKAAQMSDELLATQEKLHVLHGDLHHENILRKGNEWIMIDPQGIVGEMEYELAPFIRNPIPYLLEHEQAEAIISNRVDRLCNILELDQQRVLRWIFVQTVLAACWGEESGRDISKYEYHLKFAVLIESLITS